MQVLNSNGKKISNKENKSPSPSKQMQKIKIELNDKVFQCHKLQEDYAQDRAKIAIDFQKQRVNLSKTIKDLKVKNENDTDQWTKKMDQMRVERQMALDRLAREYEAKMQETSSNMKDLIQKDFKTQINSLTDENANLQDLLTTKEIEWSKRYEDKIYSLNSIFSKKEEEASKKNESALKGIKKECDERMSHFQQLYIKEEQLRKKIEKQLEDRIRENAKQKIILERINSQITQENQQLKEELQGAKQKIKALNDHHEASQKNHQEECKFAASHYFQEINQIKSEFQMKRQKIAEEHQSELSNIKNQIANLAVIYKQKETLWDQRGKKMLQLFERRDSKRQDVKAIETLEVELLKRDFMLERQKSEHKYCKLQLQNMQQIYDKVFYSNSSLSKQKVKSFKIKKLRAVLMNSNKSMIQKRRTTIDERCLLK